MIFQPAIFAILTMDEGDEVRWRDPLKLEVEVEVATK